jgi:hypothetical protein
VSDLVYRAGEWSRYATGEGAAAPPVATAYWGGVDLGLVHRGVASDRPVDSGAHVRALRRRALADETASQRDAGGQTALAGPAAQGNPRRHAGQPPAQSTVGRAGPRHTARDRPGRRDRHPGADHGSPGAAARPPSLGVLPIEAAVLSRQCLSQRISTAARLQTVVTAWATARNEAEETVHWRFTTTARAKLGPHYPAPAVPAAPAETDH